MSLPHFKYHEPASLVEACQMVQAFGEQGALLAGGTDLLVKMKNRELKPENIISLTELEEINQISHIDQQYSIGAGCTISQIEASVAIRSIFPALASGAGHLGSPAVRNMGTVGGNIMTASPAADMPPALIAYGANIRLKSKDQERFLPLEKIFCRPGITHIKKGEILADIHIDVPPETSGAGFFKLGTRKAMQISIINGACYFALNAENGNIETARIVLGAVAPIPVRALSAENILLGQKPCTELFEEAGEAAARDCSPIDDLRGSADYRKDMVGVLTTRTLETVLEQIRNPSKRN
jgi:carbon-monoxide dehydrogenase medium subunit